MSIQGNMKKIVLYLLITLLLFPVFSKGLFVVEAAEVTEETVTFADIVVRTAKGEGQMYDGALASYGVQKGKVLTGLSPFTTYSYDETAWTGSLGLETDDARVEHWRMFSQNNVGTVIMFTAKQDITITIEKYLLGGWVDDSILNIYIEGDTIENVYTKHLSASLTLADFGGTFELLEGETLYYEYYFEWTPHRNMEQPPRFLLTTGDDNSGGDDEPTEDLPADLTQTTTINLRTITKELMLNQGSSLIMKDMNVNVLNGRVPGSYQTFTYYEYNSITDVYNLTNVANAFDGEHSAVVQSWRMKTTLNNHAIIQVVATSDIELTLSHPATNGGWIDNAGIFIAAYIEVEGRYYQVMNKSVTSQNNPADEFGITVHLKEGDKFYWVFGSSEAYQRNLNITPELASSVENYDEEIRNIGLVLGTEGINMWDAITDTINNNYQVVNYTTFSVGFYIGNVFDEMTLFEFHEGDGTGTPSDALWDSITKNTGFQRWQIQTSPLGNAIMGITAKEDIKITVTHLPIWIDAWSTHTAIRFIAEDVDGTKVLISSRNIQTNTQENHYGIEVHLKEGQTLYIEYYTINNEWGSVNYAPRFEAAPNDFNINDTMNFDEARSLQELINQKIQDLNTLVNGLVSTNYSLSRWSTIQQTLQATLEELRLAQTESSVTMTYNNAVNAINNVKTIQQDLDDLNAYKTQKSTELDTLIASLNREAYSDDSWNVIQNAKTTFIQNIENANTRAAVDTFFTVAKTAIENAPQQEITSGLTSTQIIVIASTTSVLSIGAVILFVIKKKRII